MPGGPLSFSKRPPRTLFFAPAMRNMGLALILMLVSCVPMVRTDMPNGDHTVTTYVRLQGFDEARDDNLWVARQTCQGGVILIEEQHGIDDNGLWDKLVYGCLAR
jgi:hypothetical protein